MALSCFFSHDSVNVFEVLNGQDQHLSGYLSVAQRCSRILCSLGRLGIGLPLWHLSSTRLSELRHVPQILHSYNIAHANAYIHLHKLRKLPREPSEHCFQHTEYLKYLAH